VLTNTFSLSSRWVVLSNLFSSGRCSLWESRVHIPRRQLQHGTTPPEARQQQRRSSARPAAANSMTSSPRGGRAASRFALPPSSPQEVETGQPWPGRRWHLVGCRSRASRRRGTPAGDMSGVVLAPETTTDVVSPQRANPKWTDDASTLAKDLLDINLVPEMMVHSVPDATSPSSIDQKVPSVFHPVPFRFSFDPPSDPASVSAFVKAYPNLPGYHMWSSWDRLTVVSTYGPPGFRGRRRPRLRLGFLRAP
jgi:hypothetical protein